MQRCDDTESDDRVDAAACRSLGVRSVLVVPMLRDGMVIGILEAFSPRPDAFTDRDVQALRTLAGRVLETMSPPPRKEETVSVPVPVESDPVPVPLSIPVRVPALVPHKDPWMPVLGILILALALLLGWMLGHRTWTQSGRSDQTSTAAVPAKPATQPVDVSPSPTAPSPLVADRHPLVVPNPKMASAPPGELVVYENGKLVYEEKPRPATVRSRMVQVPFSKANALLIQRVEPLYPDQARESRTQGTVVLQVDVSEQGTVRELRTLSGDPQLAGAASDAIRQWRFRPYAPQGQALSFQTQVTMDFKLP